MDIRAKFTRECNHSRSFTVARVERVLRFHAFTAQNQSQILRSTAADAVNLARENSHLKYPRTKLYAERTEYKKIKSTRNLVPRDYRVSPRSARTTPTLETREKMTFASAR